jgi:hypothetical protein
MGQDEVKGTGAHISLTCRRPFAMVRRVYTQRAVRQLL